MKRLLALLLCLGVLFTAAPGLVTARGDDEKKDKKDDKKEEKKKEEKKAEKKEEKLTDAQKEDLKKLTGTFTVVTYVNKEGKKATPDELKKMKVVQKGAEWTVFDGEDQTKGKDTVFPDKTPREVNSTYVSPQADKVVKGIYKIEGDTVTYCFSEPDKDRPKDFKGEGGNTLMVLKLVKEEAKKEEKKKEEKKDEKKDDK